ncbi:probable acyl-CoA dehydrogenase 6 isoform X2 [Pollicipes pollicipes]|uniref:probable acyl-CoA dehydrogenase 6 isoform X2 n=1 Tax=Pollicipes pollicipes TaxID=41117 RepID=UPI00188500B9|nr:probable acyl-CoA dehydrogenase 6 isoform X2 [Pollicipes pollicipes]
MFHAYLSTRVVLVPGAIRQSRRFISLSPTQLKVNACSIYKEDHKEIQNTLKKIIDKDINPHVDQWEAEGKFPAREVFKKLGSAGLLGVTKPTGYGGLGLDQTYEAAVLEQLGHIPCGGVPMGIGIQIAVSTPILARCGSDRLKREFLAPSVAGDLVSCLGVSEPGSGSDVASIQTRAERKGDDLVINGQKMWITNGCQADWICLLANTNKGAPHKSKSLICVPMDTKGVTIAKRIDKMGMRSSDTAQIFFEDVRVPADNIIGEEGKGFTYQMEQFQEERMAGIALSLVPMELCIQQTIEYTRQRKAFGKSILDNQVVHFTLAELQTEVELLRSLLYRSVESFVQGEDVTELVSMGKLKSGRLVREVSDKCLQFWGGMGFTNEVLVSRFYRDLRLLSIGAGADEVMLSIIAKYMGTLPKPGK